MSKMDKLGLSWNEIFMTQKLLSNKKTKDFSGFTIDFSEQKTILKKQFEALHEIALQTDKSFTGAVKAQEKKQLKGLENLEKRLLKAERKNHSSKLERIFEIQNELFPNKSLQERTQNFSNFFSEVHDYDSFVRIILEKTNPLEQNFTSILL